VVLDVLLLEQLSDLMNMLMTQLFLDLLELLVPLKFMPDSLNRILVHFDYPRIYGLLDVLVREFVHLNCLVLLLPYSIDSWLGRSARS
jgi:hypothetical protein